eukprot:m51a1_g115 putative mediator of rna polymerase ii transcription subunit 14 (1256) ;mRNA; f:351084-356222
MPATISTGQSNCRTLILSFFKGGGDKCPPKLPSSISMSQLRRNSDTGAAAEGSKLRRMSTVEYASTPHHLSCEIPLVSPNDEEQQQQQHVGADDNDDGVVRAAPMTREDVCDFADDVREAVRAQVSAARMEILEAIPQAEAYQHLSLPSAQPQHKWQPAQMHHISAATAGPSNVKVAAVLNRLVNATNDALRDLVVRSAEMTDEERKRALLGFVEQARRQFLRLLVVVRWAPKMQQLTSTYGIQNAIREQEHFFGIADNHLHYLLTAALPGARTSVCDTDTAIDVLSSGTYNKLPLAIADVVPPRPPSPPTAAAMVQAAERALQSRLFGEDLAPQYTSAQIERGQLVLRVEGEFEVSLTLQSDEPQAPFRIRWLRILVPGSEAVADPSKVVPPDVWIGDAFVYHLRDELQRRLLEWNGSNRCIEAIYNVLHDYCLQIKTSAVTKEAESIKSLYARCGVEVVSEPTGFSLYYWKAKTSSGHGQISQQQAAQQQQPVTDYPRLKLFTDEWGVLHLIHKPSLKDPDTGDEVLFTPGPDGALHMALHRALSIQMMSKLNWVLPLLKEKLGPLCKARLERRENAPHFPYVCVPLWSGQTIQVSVSMTSGELVVVNSSDSVVTGRFRRTADEVMKNLSSNRDALVDLVKKSMRVTCVEMVARWTDLVGLSIVRETENAVEAKGTTSKLLKLSVYTLNFVVDDKFNLRLNYFRPPVPGTNESATIQEFHCMQLNLPEVQEMYKEFSSKVFQKIHAICIEHAKGCLRKELVQEPPESDFESWECRLSVETCNILRNSLDMLRNPGYTEKGNGMLTVEPDGSCVLRYARLIPDIVRADLSCIACSFLFDSERENLLGDVQSNGPYTVEVTSKKLFSIEGKIGLPSGVWTFKIRQRFDGTGVALDFFDPSKIRRRLPLSVCFEHLFRTNPGDFLRRLLHAFPPMMEFMNAKSLPGDCTIIFHQPERFRVYYRMTTAVDVFCQEQVVIIPCDHVSKTQSMSLKPDMGPVMHTVPVQMGQKFILYKGNGSDRRPGDNRRPETIGEIRANAALYYPHQFKADPITKRMGLTFMLVYFTRVAKSENALAVEFSSNQEEPVITSLTLGTAPVGKKIVDSLQQRLVPYCCRMLLRLQPPATFALIASLPDDLAQEVLECIPVPEHASSEQNELCLDLYSVPVETIKLFRASIEEQEKPRRTLSAMAYDKQRRALHAVLRVKEKYVPIVYFHLDRRIIMVSSHVNHTSPVHTPVNLTDTRSPLSSLLRTSFR